VEVLDLEILPQQLPLKDNQVVLEILALFKLVVVVEVHRLQDVVVVLNDRAEQEVLLLLYQPALMQVVAEPELILQEPQELVVPVEAETVVRHLAAPEMQILAVAAEEPRLLLVVAVVQDFL
jgi:hypothetical protein